MVERLEQECAERCSGLDVSFGGHSNDEQETLLQAVMDACASGVAMLDDSGIILHVNKAWRHCADQDGLVIDGYGVGLNYLELFEAVSSTSSDETAAVAAGIRQILAGKQTEFQLEYPCYRPATQRWFLMHAARFDLPVSGGALRILVTHEDITSNKQAREVWRKEEERLRLLLDTTNILPWEADAESWRFTYVGGQANKMLGYPIGQWYEPDFWTAHIHPEDVERAIADCLKYAELLDHYEFEYRMIARDGRIVWIHDLVSVIREDSKPKTIRGFMIDITERKHAEEVLQDLSGRLISAQEEERSRIARELHDDLNQRMALLSIELEQLGQKIPPRQSDLRRSVKELQAKAQEISTEIHHLSYQLHPSKLDHLGLAAAVKSFCHDLSASQEINIEFHQQGFPAALPKDITLCVFRIAQESLRNCIKHSGARAAQVVLEKTDRAVRLSVSDTGCGFDTESGTMTRGLGFISMRERLRLVGGEISIHSQPSRGTHIDVSVPLMGQA